MAAEKCGHRLHDHHATCGREKYSSGQSRKFFLVFLLTKKHIKLVQRGTHTPILYLVQRKEAVSLADVSRETHESMGSRLYDRPTLKRHRHTEEEHSNARHWHCTTAVAACFISVICSPVPVLSIGEKIDMSVCGALIREAIEVKCSMLPNHAR